MSLASSVVDVSTRRPVTISMFIIACLIFGLVLVDRLGLTLLPDLSYPTLTVRTEYTGAAPAEIENLITKPIEESIGVVKNLREVRSVSRAGQSDVTLEFNWGTDMGMAGLDVREKLDIVPLPLDVKRPSLLRFNPSLAPIVRLSLSKTNVEFVNESLEEKRLIELRRFADEEIKRRVESIEGIASVKISGGLEDEIQVLVDQQKMAQLNLSIQQVAQRLNAENVNLSGGRLEEGNQQFLVRTINQYQSVDEIANSIISRVGERPVYLKDIADVQQRYKEREAITRLNGNEAVEISIYKEGDANTVAVAKRLMSRLDFIKKNFPDNISIETVYDQSQFIENAIDEVINNAIFGGLLAMLVLYLFLKNFRATLIISLSIPISVIISFNMMFGYGITMNIMSLGGLALAVGLLVDNAIVVLENIARKREEGADDISAARDGAKEVAGAIFAATLTTVAVFLPLVFVEGIAGQLFSDQALTVTFALLISLIIALTFIPMVSALKQRKNPYHSEVEPQPPTSWYGRAIHFVFTRMLSFIISIPMTIMSAFAFIIKFPMQILATAFQWFYGHVERIYRVLLRKALNAKAMVLLIAVSVFGGSLLLIERLGMELIPQLSQGELLVEIKTQPGTPLIETDKIIKESYRLIQDLPEVAKVFSVSGSGNRLDASPEKGGENRGELTVQLARPVTQSTEDEAIANIRLALQKIPGIDINIEKPALFTFETPLEVEILGFNLEKLTTVNNQLIALMKQDERFSDIKSTVLQGHPEVQIEFDHEKAAFLGLNVPDIASNIVKKLKGEVATKYAFRDRKIDVLVRVSEDERSSIEDIRKLVVNPQSEKPITLDAIANVKVEIGPNEIHRVSQQRVAFVQANLSYGDLGQGAKALQLLVDQLPDVKGIEVRVAGQNEEMQRSFDSLKMALLLAVFLVYLVMASQFESLLHPFVILFSVPLSLIGAILALYITNSTVSVVVFIGLIMLAGIVVNNAIVLIDRINQGRQKGAAIIDAVIEAGEARLRPIVMTTLTTAFGMLPLALGLGEGAEIRAPMAITVIGGLLISTLLTLIVIPVLYLVMDRSR